MNGLIKKVGNVVIFIAIAIVLYCISLTITKHLNTYVLACTVMISILCFIRLVVELWYKYREDK